MNSQSKLPETIIHDSPWGKESQSIWLATVFDLHRNLAGSFFSSKLTAEEQQRQLQLMVRALKEDAVFANASLLKMNEISALDKEFILEHFLLFQDLGPPSAQKAILFDPSARFMALINFSDHLVLRHLCFERHLDEDWNKFSDLEHRLQKVLGFSFSSKFGFLTPEPEYCGTGLKLYAYLHVPALIHSGKIQEALQKDLEGEITFLGLEGHSQEFMGDVVVLTQKASLGLTEETILNALNISATKLMASEKAMRTYLSNHRNVEMKDQVARAYGLLMHSYQLQIKEALEALSLLKVGLDLGWVTGISMPKLNELFFRCRRSHLRLCENFEEDLEAVPRKRAEYLHKHLKNLRLLTESFKST